MAVKQLDYTDLSEVTTEVVSALFDVVAIGTFDENNVEFVDDFDGDILKTAIAEISDNDLENKVYLLNLGYAVGADTPPLGSSAVAGDHRGWLKLRILKNAQNYVLQYAHLDDASFQEVEIAKNLETNFTFFSFDTNTIDVEPNKKDWDMCFTVFTNEIPGYGTYGYTDFIISNNLQQVQAYSIDEDEGLSFEDFERTDIDEANFDVSQRAIGSSWRVGGGPGVSPQVKNNLFYLLKDTEGFYYKIKFATLTNKEGERGFPQFKYSLIKNN